MLRAPGTVNHKINGHPVPVTLQDAVWEQRYSVNEMLDALPPVSGHEHEHAQSGYQQRRTQLNEWHPAVARAYIAALDTFEDPNRGSRHEAAQSAVAALVYHEARHRPGAGDALDRLRVQVCDVVRDNRRPHPAGRSANGV